MIKKIIEDYGLFDHLNSWDERGKGLLLDLAAYSIISENNADGLHSGSDTSGKNFSKLRFGYIMAESSSDILPIVVRCGILYFLSGIYFRP